MADFLEILDHSMCINTDDSRYAAFKDFYGDRVIDFESSDPTAEVMAKEQLAEYARTSTQRYPLRNNHCLKLH